MKERIIGFLETQNEARKLEDISTALGIKTVEDEIVFEKCIQELENELVLYFTKSKKYMLYTKCANFRKGIISVNKKGFGFVKLETNEEDIHIAVGNIGLALDGDLVLVEYLDYDKAEGKVLKVLNRSLKNLVGEIKSDGKSLYFEPKEKRNITLKLDSTELAKCVEGEIVVVTLGDNINDNIYMGNISKHVGHKDDANIDILTVAAKYDIYPEFGEEVKKQLETISSEVEEKDKIGRVDLTDEVIFTIDGADTKDIDDAIGIKKDGDDYILKVSIADVSYYVKENSPLDIEAQNRGTSSYLAYSVIPMLPHQLSNGICSLNPNVLRCAMTCEMRIDKRGVVIDSSIYPSLIKSNIKMTYASVNHLLEDGIIDEGYENFADDLTLMLELAHIIRKEREGRGASDFDSPEAKIICDSEGHPIDIVPRERGEGERLIEDFMIVANETVASTIYNMDLPGVYRVHDVPAPEKIEQFINFCSRTGHEIKGKFNTLNPKTFQKLLDQVEVEGRAEKIYKSLAIRSMKKAFYSKDNIGHFGLASRCYTHFTSPIRRYPDLMEHRLLRKYLVEGALDVRTINYYEANLESICRLASEREVAAVEAEREVDKMKMAEFMQDHVGEEFVGVISGVSNFGMFVELDNLVEGLVPVNSLEGDYYEYVEEASMLIGKNSKISYTIGDEIKVKVARASKEQMQIDFEVVREKDLSNPKKKELRKINNEHKK